MGVFLLVIDICIHIFSRLHISFEVYGINIHYNRVTSVIGRFHGRFCNCCNILNRRCLVIVDKADYFYDGL